MKVLLINHSDHPSPICQTLMNVQTANTCVSRIATTQSAPTRAAAMPGMPSTLMGEDVTVNITADIKGRGEVRRSIIIQV